MKNEPIPLIIESKNPGEEPELESEPEPPANLDACVGLVNLTDKLVPVVLPFSLVAVIIRT